MPVTSAAAPPTTDPVGVLAMSLADASDAVRNRMAVKGRKDSSVNDYVERIDLFRGWFHGEQGREPTVGDLTVLMADPFMRALESEASDRGRRWANATRGKYVADLRGFGKHLAAALGLAGNPLAGMSADRPRNGRGGDALGPEQVVALFAALRPGRRYDTITRGILALGLEDGPRTSELTRLDVTDYATATMGDLELGPVINLRLPAKTSPPRVLPLGQVADDLIRASIGNRTTGPLFPDRSGERMTPRAMRDRVHRAGLRADIALDPQRMRRSASSWQQTFGAGSGHVDAVFGWEPNPADVKSGHYTRPSLVQLLHAHQARVSPLDRLEKMIDHLGIPGTLR